MLLCNTSNGFYEKVQRKLLDTVRKQTRMLLRTMKLKAHLPQLWRLLRKNFQSIWDLLQLHWWMRLIRGRGYVCTPFFLTRLSFKNVSLSLALYFLCQQLFKNHLASWNSLIDCQIMNEIWAMFWFWIGTWVSKVFLSWLLSIWIFE